MQIDRLPCIKIIKYNTIQYNTIQLLSLGANAVGFLSKNLWLLAVAVAYALYEKKTTK